MDVISHINKHSKSVHFTLNQTVSLFFFSTAVLIEIPKISPRSASNIKVNCSNLHYVRNDSRRPAGGSPALS